MRAGINPAPTVLFVGEGFIPSLLVQLPRESGRDLVFAGRLTLINPKKTIDHRRYALGMG